MKFPIPDKTEPLVDVFNFEEENTIRYVGGYVIAVLKKYQSDKEIIVGLNQLTNNNTEINAAWVQELHRLTMITVQAQDVFMSIEANIKSKLRVNKAHKMDKQRRHQLQNELFCDSDVQFSWCLSVINLKTDNEAAEEILELPIDQWIIMIENSFTTSIVQFY